MLKPYLRIIIKLSPCCTQVCLKTVEYFIQTVGRFEDAIFAKRARLLASQRARRIRDKEREANMKVSFGLRAA